MVVQDLTSLIGAIRLGAVRIEEEPRVVHALGAPIEVVRQGDRHIPQVLEVQAQEAQDTVAREEAVRQEVRDTEAQVAEVPEVRVALEALAEVPEVRVVSEALEVVVPGLPVPDHLVAEAEEEDHNIKQSIF